MFTRPLLFLLCALAPAFAAAACEEDGILYVSPAGSANNATGHALALRADGGLHAAGISFLRGVNDTPTLDIRRLGADGNENPRRSHAE